MTSRQRLRRCFFHQELDRPGVYFRTMYPANDPTYGPVRAYIEAHTDLKIGFDVAAFESRPPTTVRREPYSEDFVRQVVTLHAPRGDLEASTLVELRLLPSMHERYFIKTVEDARTYLSLPLPELSGDADGFRAAEKTVGQRGIVDAAIGSCPAGVVAELLGSENFAFFSISEREVLHELCRRQQEIILRRVKFALGLGLGPFFSTLGQEYLVPPLHGPADFADFCVRYDQPIFDLIHNAGGRIHVHCHSKVGQVFGAFLDLGVDVLHPIEPPPMGDLTARDAKRLARGRMCLEGNIQIAHMYEHTPQQVAAETAALMADAFDDHRGLIVCPTASLYQRGKGGQCLAQVKALVETVLACP